MSSGSVRCWGANGQQQVGINSLGEPVLKPRELGEVKARMLRSGWRHSCLIDPEDQVRCWGDGSRGQLGDGSWGPAVSNAVPQLVATSKKAKQLALGRWHSCALLEGGEVECWGSGERGQLGDGVLGDGHLEISPKKALLNPGVERIEAGGDWTCGQWSTGEIQCWGGVSTSESGKESITQPVKIDGLLNPQGFSIGGFHGCATEKVGTVRCWGANESGQLGRGVAGTGTLKADPSKKLNGSPMTGVVQVTAGERHNCALLDITFTVQCWGANESGQLGNQGANAPHAVTLVGLVGVKSLSAGGSHTCAVESSQEGLKCWGANGSGQLGRGMVGEPASPASVVW
jgi:alpha-tubulin suppressor-like RCC1 family protein